MTVSILIPLIVGGVSALISKNGMETFQTLNKPPLSPPDRLFPIVWTLLYIMMGIASYLIFTAEGDIEDRKSSLMFYVVQLFLNFAWSVIFFDMQLYFFAFLWLVALWAMILITLIKFFRINKCAGLLMLPYLLWVTFAGYLNFEIFLLN